MSKHTKIISQIGFGAFGNVFLCDYKGERGVIKRIPFDQDTDYVMSELKILRYCNNPRIIKFFDFFYTNSNFNFIMEHACNGSVRDFISNFQRNNWKMPQDDLVGMFLDMAFGLKYLHTHNIIHRDLKPENCLLVEDYRVKIADFGISKIVENSSVANHQTIIGTLCYMSPEVFLHQPYDSSCDIWGLGLIFYELAMMKYPFTRADKARIMNPNLSFKPPLIEYEMRKYDYHVQLILEKMVQRDPKKRSKINKICGYSYFESSPYYKKLLRDDKKYP